MTRAKLNAARRRLDRHAIGPITLDLGDDSPSPVIVAKPANSNKQPKPDYYSGGCRVVKGGIPCRVAPWFKSLTSQGKSMVGANNQLCVIRNDRARLEKQSREYKQFLFERDRAAYLKTDSRGRH